MLTVLTTYYTHHAPLHPLPHCRYSALSPLFPRRTGRRNFRPLYVMWRYSLCMLPMATLYSLRLYLLRGRRNYPLISRAASAERAGEATSAASHLAPSRCESAPRRTHCSVRRCRWSRYASARQRAEGEEDPEGNCRCPFAPRRAVSK